MRRLVLLLVLLTSIARPGVAQADHGADPFRSRRDRALAQGPHALLIVTSQVRPALAGVQQTPNFFYLTGLESMLGGVLVLDGPNRQARLFYAPALPGFAGFIASLPPGRQDTAGLGRAGLDRVEPWSAFAPYITRRLAEDSSLILAVDVDDGELPEVGTPLDTAVGTPAGRFREAVARRWAQTRVEKAGLAMLRLRMVKDSVEVDGLRRTGRASAAAFLAGLAAVRQGVRQRAVEGAVVAACLGRGGQGPSFWPWAMSGPNAAYPRPWKSLEDYHHADREISPGELVRLDIGCEVEHYMGDVGRTIPASGMYDPGQRETWNLLQSAYRAGLREIRDSVPVTDVFAASFREVARRQGALRTDLAQAAAKAILAGKPPDWQIHGIGLEPAEPVPPVLRAGMVIDYEPIFTLRGQGFYLEDMILVTRTGYEILTPGLPYTAAEVEDAMRRAHAGTIATSKRGPRP